MKKAKKKPIQQDIPFIFTFGHDNPEAYYEGRFYLDNTLFLFEIDVNSSNGIATTRKLKDPWELVYKHATFEGMLSPMFSYYEDSEKHIPNSPQNLQDNEAYNKYRKEMLQSIRDNPTILLSSDKRPRIILQRILTAAKKDLDKNVRDEMRSLLRDNLIPSHKKSKRIALPSGERLKMLKELMNKLADHLSEKCEKDYLKGEDIREDSVFCGLLEWARDNDLRIHAIAKKSRESIKLLGQFRHIVTP